MLIIAVRGTGGCGMKESSNEMILENFLLAGAERRMREGGAGGLGRPVRATD
jgi:hypothetical protein